MIGSGRYVVGSPGRAEVAFVVEEDYHGQGIASLLVRHLASVAAAQGIRTFEADVLGENKAMLAVFARTGWPMQCAPRRRRKAHHADTARCSRMTPR